MFQTHAWIRSAASGYLYTGMFPHKVCSDIHPLGAGVATDLERNCTGGTQVA